MRVLTTCLLVASLPLSTTAFAQTSPGAPAEGVQIQGYYSSPEDLQRMAQTPAPTQQGQVTQGAPAGVQGADAAAVDPYRDMLQQMRAADAARQAEAPAATGVGDAAAAPADRSARPEIDMSQYDDYVNEDTVLREGAAAGEAPAPTSVNGADIYQGVTPDVKDSLPHISREQNRATPSRNHLTWIGFQPFDTKSRVFLQTGSPAEYRVEESPDGLTLVVKLRATDINISNFARNVDARYFGRVVSTIEASEVGGGVTEVRITLAADAAYEVSADGNYLYLDFPLR